MRLYNTLNKQIEEVVPQQDGTTTIYTCGPTVYDYPHIGNWFTFIRYDLLVRALSLEGLKPTWVMNITDVGHLVNDADEGEDKLEKGARREGKTAWDVARYYGDYFVEALKRLNITTPDYLPKATEHIAEQIELVKTLEAKGYTYIIDDGVYFDTSKFPRYADFAQLDTDEQQAGKRVAFNAQKRNISDFALWKFSPVGQQRDMEWDSPWGQKLNGRKGFPGWHLECSAMAMKYLGETIDIHAGGIDHVPVHHTNEIAQSEAATGKRFANYWMHTNHISIEGEKISKSLGNGITLEDIEAKTYSLEVLRMHVLESHYRSQSKFSWDSLEASKNRLERWHATAAQRWQAIPATTPHDTESGLSEAETPSQHPLIEQSSTYLKSIREALVNDLDTPAALFAIDQMMGLIETEGMSSIILPNFNQMLQLIDQGLGISLFDEDITDEQKQRIAQRQEAREAKDWATSDELRDRLLADGIGVRDGQHGPIWFRTTA